MRRSSIDFILAGYAIISAIFLIINLLTDRSSIWAIWPIWVFGGITAAITAMIRFPRNRLAATWLGGGGILVAGLTVINLTNDSGNLWFIWPLGVWLVIGILLIGMTVDLLSSIPTSRLATEEEIEQDRQRRLPPT